MEKSKEETKKLWEEFFSKIDLKPLLMEVALELRMREEFPRIEIPKKNQQNKSCTELKTPIE